MSTLVTALTVLLAGWIGALALVVFWKLLRGEIALTGMLEDQNGRLSPERVQLMVVTVLGALAYLHEAIVAGPDGEPGTLTLPDAPLSLVLAVGGSNALYLAAKQLRFLTGPR